jgi:predicted nucleic acid-binding protein
MARPALVLDTNALASKEFRFWLTQYEGRKILPLVAFVEAGVHEAARGKLDAFRAYLVQAGIEIEWMRLAEADRTIEATIGSVGFAENARDYLIAGHVHSGRILVTSNLRDFAFLNDKRTPTDAMKAFS